MIKKILLHIFFILFLSAALSATENTIIQIKNLNSHTNPTVKEIRQDIRKSIYVIKSKRDLHELPGLKFYKYRVRKGDTFWKILTKLSLDIDTLMTINNLTSPNDVIPGLTLYIPNMRGIILKGSSRKQIDATLKKNKVAPQYVLGANRITNFNRKYLFIPCGKISNLERSLFLGSGFSFPIVKGKRSSGFGRRRNPFNRKKNQFHSGVDIACPIGSKVRAARHGKVVYTGTKGNYGRLIVLKHEHGYSTYYGHLSRILVKKGDTIRRGRLIAMSGNTGRTTGPHLHFEVRRKNSPINPGILLKK